MTGYKKKKKKKKKTENGKRRGERDGDASKQRTLKLNKIREIETFQKLRAESRVVTVLIPRAR